MPSCRRLAIAVQASVFVAATTITGRDRPPSSTSTRRPRPRATPAGTWAPPTALYLTFALMAQRIERTWLRRLVTIVCIIVPFLVGYARLYRGMHQFVRHHHRRGQRRGLHAARLELPAPQDG